MPLNSYFVAPSFPLAHGKAARGKRPQYNQIQPEPFSAQALQSIKTTLWCQHECQQRGTPTGPGANGPVKFRRFLTPGMAVLDIGANAATALARWQPVGHVETPCQNDRPGEVCLDAGNEIGISHDLAVGIDDAGKPRAALPGRQ